MAIKQKIALILLLSIAAVGFFGKTSYAADATMSTSGNITYHDGVYSKVTTPSANAAGYQYSGCKNAQTVYLKPGSGAKGVEVICYFDGAPSPVSYYRYVNFPNATRDPETGSVNYGGPGDDHSGGGVGSYRTITVAPASNTNTTTTPGSVSSNDPSSAGGDSEPSGTNNSNSGSNNGSNTSTGGTKQEQAPAYTKEDQDAFEDAANCNPDKDKCCSNVKTSILSFVCGKDAEGNERDPITTILFIVLNVLTAAIGIAAVGGIAYGALLYTTAQSSPEQTKRAISIITNVVIGIVAYGLMYVLLNFLVPGGVFS